MGALHRGESYLMTHLTLSLNAAVYDKAATLELSPLGTLRCWPPIPPRRQLPLAAGFFAGKIDQFLMWDVCNSFLLRRIAPLVDRGK